MQVLHDQFDEHDGISVLAVQVDDRGDVAAYMDKGGFTFPMVRNAVQMSADFSIERVPTFVVIDGDGRVVHRSVGELTNERRDMIEQIARSAAR